MLNAQSLIAEAEQQAGFTDTDTKVHLNLEKLVEALNSDFPMSAEGETRAHSSLLRDAVNRIEGLKWLHEYPEIADEPIEAPVFLMGLPRSGTTYFQYLFDRDHRFRLIRTSESVSPSPPPGLGPEVEAQRKAVWAEIQKQHGHFEGFEAMHLYDEDGSDECHAFLEQSYGAAGLNNLYRVPTYFDWLMDELDLVETYRIHRRQLQLLQWRRERKPWALKYPNHLIAVKEILEVYPDARFVMTHRDPVQVVASISKMSLNLRGMCSAEKVDYHQVGRDMLHFIQRHIDRIMAFEQIPGAERIIHVDYYALVEDPVREMRSIHERLGIGTPDEVARAVGDWHNNNPKNARGKNDYTLEQYGLDDNEVARQFATYRERYNIPRESEGLARISTA